MPGQDRTVLWDRWVDLWNGDLAAAGEIVHPEFAIHRIPPPSISDRAGGREGLLEWIRQTRPSSPKPGAGRSSAPRD
jgi:hypothetical protein